MDSNYINFVQLLKNHDPKEASAANNMRFIKRGLKKIVALPHFQNYLKERKHKHFVNWFDYHEGRSAENSTDEELIFLKDAFRQLVNFVAPNCNIVVPEETEKWHTAQDINFMKFGLKEIACSLAGNMQSANEMRRLLHV